MRKMTGPSVYLHPRDEILALMQRIYQYRMTTTSGGNLSIHDDNGDIWITPAGFDKGSLHREDIVCVHPCGSFEGGRAPSSEIQVHQKIYQARPDLRGVVHAHPAALVAFSIARTVPDTTLLPQARLVCKDAAFAPYALPGSAALGNLVADACSRGHNAVIMENHGVVTGGTSLTGAFRCFETLEFAAKTVIRARVLGNTIRNLSQRQLAMGLSEAYPMPELPPHLACSAEKELRCVLAEFVRRAYRQRLFISTEGTFSARLEDNSYLITPSDFDRGVADPGGLVLVRNGRAEMGKTPSPAVALHDAIYSRHPLVGAVINACPVNATAFSMTDAPLDTRTIPESYVVVRRVGRVEYDLAFQDADEVAGRISPATPALLLQNDGVLVTGKSVLEAYDRLEVLESTAEALIDCRALGELCRMPDRVILELTNAYGVPQ